MKKTLQCAIVFGTMLVAISACASQDSKLIGRWEGEGPKGIVYYEFSADHSYTISDNYGTQKGTWRLEGSTLLLKTTSLTVTKKYAQEAGLPEADFPRTESDFEDAPETAADIAVQGDELTVTMEGTTISLAKR